MACRRWANVGPTVKKPLAQRRQPTSDRRMCRRWANVGPTAECYLGINQQILAQLSDIGQRLKKVVKADCKKTNDLTRIKNRSTHAHSKPTPNMTTKSTESTVQPTITSALPDTVTVPFNFPSIPPLADIRQNAKIQQKVDQRIKELQQLSHPGMDTKIKSLRGGTVDIFVKHRFKWPHEHVLAGNTKERVSYDQLTMGQWMNGFCRTIREEKNKNKRSYDWLFNSTFGWFKWFFLVHGKSQPCSAPM